MPICLYCGKEKQETELSQEHIVPRSMGGVFEPVNPFSVNDVCTRCNTISGMFIDEPFVKNWFMHNYRVEVVLKYFDITKSDVVPLRYMGVSDGLEHNGKIAEIWMGPTGDTIFHFHDPYPEEPDTLPQVGTPAYLKKYDIDKGFVVSFVRSNNPSWHKCILYSIYYNFKGSQLYLANGNTPDGGVYSEPPAELTDLIAKLTVMMQGQLKAQISMSQHFADRFLAKLALGFGRLVLTDSFVTSKSADKLRRFMWTKSHEERMKIPIHGAGPLTTALEDLQKFMSWPGSHLIALMPVQDKLLLFASFFGAQSAIIQISEEPAHWADKIIDMGLFYIINPGLKRYVGPKPLQDIIAFNIREVLDYDLVEMETDMQQIPPTPPFDI